MDKEKNLPADFVEGLNAEAETLKNLSPRGSFNLDEYLVDLSKEVPDPVVLLLQESTKRPIFTEGSLSLILGASKSRKTTLAVGLCAALLGKPTLGMLAMHKDYKITFVDTEQGLHFSHKTARKVHKLMGWDIKKNNDRLRYYDLRKLSKKERREFILDVVERDKPDILFIDGLVDLCDDFNDNKISTALIDEYLKLSAENKMHICTCLHVNKDGQTARGHLGAMYMQKCETTIQVIYHDYYSEVVPAVEGCRHLMFEKFAFQMVGFDGLPALFDATQIVETNKPSTAEEKAKAIVEKVFAQNDYKIITYNELSRRMVVESEHFGSKPIKQRTAFNYIRDLTKSGYLIKDNIGGYSLGRFREDTQTEIEYPEEDEE